MHANKSLLAFGAMTGALFIAATASAQWTQYLGPDRTAVTELAIGNWKNQKPQQVWAVDCGPGFGGAAIDKGTVYILDRVEGEADVFRALALASGKEIWRHQYPAPGRLSHHGSRSVPTIVGDRAYTVGGFGHLTCYDLKAQKKVWQLDLDEDFQTPSLKWGYAQSPLVLGDHVIVTPPHPDSPRLAAYDVKTGKRVWAKGTGGGDYYVSPALRTIAGVTGILQLTNSKVSFHDTKTGEELFTWSGWKCTWPIPSPTVLSDGKHVMITGGYGAGSVMLEVTRNGNNWKVNEKFRLKEGCQLHPFIEYDGYLYGNINENATLKKKTKAKGGLACVDPKSGKVLWRTGENPNFGRGAVLLGKDGLLIVDGNLGGITAVKPSPKSFSPVGDIAAFDHKSGDQKIWGPIAIVNRAIVVRDHEQIKAFRLPTP